MQTWFTRVRERPGEEYIGSHLQDTVDLPCGDSRGQRRKAAAKRGARDCRL
jgi:hypothetical protein